MKNIVVYTSSTCPYCTMVKEYLKNKGFEYSEKNVSTDVQARQELMKKGHTGVPVVYVDDTEIVGFDKAKLDEILG